MQFPQAMQVREITVVGGQKVKKGEVLVRARDAEITSAMDQQRDKASNDLEIQGAQKQMELAEFKFNEIKASKTFAPTEFEEARIAAETAHVQWEQAKRNKIQEELRLKQLEGQFERYWLEAPFDGTIEEVLVEVGMGCTEQEKVLRMVNTDKLWLDPYAETYETIRLGLKEGSPAWVLVDMPDAPKLVRGKVLYVSPVADSVSQTRRVRVEIDNPQAWPAGTQGRVRFTEPSAEWDKYKSEAGQAHAEAPAWINDMVRAIADGSCGAPCVQNLCNWLDNGDLSVARGTPQLIADRFESDEIRDMVAETMADAESRSSLLAGAGSGDSRYFLPTGQLIGCSFRTPDMRFASVESKQGGDKK